jgi:Protein of unknown function (DUF2924)
LLDSSPDQSGNGLLSGVTSGGDQEGKVLKTGLEVELKRLPQMDRAALREMWESLFGRLPEPGLRRETLVPVLAFRLQEKIFGGIRPSTARRLKTLAEECSVRQTLTEGRVPRLSPGTRIVREWQGKLHEVSVLESNFAYCGETYRSLSEIAREITGTRWSGPAFFGLKKRRRAR